MKIVKIAATVALCAAVFTLAACQYSPDTVERSVGYNYAISDSTNQILVLNIIRASQRGPRYFSRLGSNSAQTTFNPSIGLTVPLNGLSSTGAAAQVVGTPQGTVQNVVGIDNLDDKKYQEGALQTVSMATVDQFWNQGLQPDLLGLLFIGEIEIPAAELKILSGTLTTFCSAHANTEKFCDSEESLATAEGLSKSTAQNCLDSSKIPLARRRGVDYAVYVNDPASEDLDPTAMYHPEFCFQVVLRDLLALGLHPAASKPIDQVDQDIPEKLAFNPQFRTEMIKAGNKVSRKENGKLYDVTKEAAETVFVLDSEAAADIRNDDDFRATVMRCDDFQQASLKTDPDLHCRDLDRGHKTHNSAQDKAWKANIAKDRLNARPIDVKELKIALDLRSFEGIIYYLGEVVRSEGGKKATGLDSRPYFLAVLSRQRWGDQSRYEERLFYLRDGVAADNAALSVADDQGKHYWIPDRCLPEEEEINRKPAPSCSTEYPDHESKTVLTVVNEIWGLQKEPSTAPTPTITVGGS